MPSHEVAPVPTPINGKEGPPFSTPLPTVNSWIFGNSHPCRCEVYLTMVLISISMMINDVE